MLISALCSTRTTHDTNDSIPGSCLGEMGHPLVYLETCSGSNLLVKSHGGEAGGGLAKVESFCSRGEELIAWDLAQQIIALKCTEAFPQNVGAGFCVGK